MKKTIIHITLILLLSFTSCEEWLDVSPASEIKSEELFSSERGFREALFGIYSSMCSDDTYGGNLTMSFLDALAQNYIIMSSGEAFYDASRYEYDVIQVEERIANIWHKMYFTIANCNNLLENIEGKENLFVEDNYSFFIAETKALRAFLHFDLLRMFAPSIESGGLDAMAIPFVDRISKAPLPQLTVDQMLEQIIGELQEAKEILAPIDPIGPVFSEYEDDVYVPTWQQNMDAGFLFHRVSRMNYYAVTGLLARVYLYKGDTENALAQAKEVISSSKFALIEENDLVGDEVIPDIIFKKEFVFALFNDKLKEKSDKYFKKDANSELKISTARKAYYYEGYGASLVDYRGRFQFDTHSHYVLKYTEDNGYKGTYLPMLRLSEMYYIAIECESNEDNALAYLNEVRIHRGLVDYQEDAMVDFEEELFKEYRKEFIAEGQMFYYLKRKNYIDIPFSSVDGSDDVYVLPIPDVELEFGDIK